MDYSCHTLHSGSAELMTANFLGDAAREFLDNCEGAVFSHWQDTFPKFRSITPILATAVLDHLEKIPSLVRRDFLEDFVVMRAFNNSMYSGHACLGIFREFKRTRKDFVILAESTEFRKKFLIDSTYMTLDQFSQYFLDFVSVMEPQATPNLHFIVFEDMNFDVGCYRKASKKYIELTPK